MATAKNVRPRVELAFRIALFGQTAAIFTQAFLAGSALSGSAGAFRLHMILGSITVVIALTQLVLGFFLVGQRARAALAGSAGLVAGEGLQMLFGRLQLFALHIPLGVALFAAAVAFSLWVLNDVSAREYADNDALADVAVRTA